MYFIAKLHPDLEGPGNELYKVGNLGPWLSEREKRAVIDQFYTEGASRIPLSLDHRNAGRFGFISHEDVIGHVLDLYNNQQGDLMVKCRLERAHPDYLGILSGIYDKQQRWGVSVGLAQGTDGEGGRAKRLVHVAFTPDPGFAAYDTHLFRYHLDEDVLNAAIARDWYKAGEGRAYASPVFDEKLKRMHNFDSPRDFHSLGAGSQESGIVRILQQMSDSAAQQPQAVADQNSMQVEAAPQQQAPIVYKPLDLTGMDNLESLDTIKRNLAVMKQHMLDMGKIGHTWADYDQKFQDTFTTLTRESAALEKSTKEYWQKLRESNTIAPTKLDQWGNLMTSTKMDEQDAREQLMNLACASNTLLQQTVQAEKRKHEEEVSALRQQLEEANAKKVKPNAASDRGTAMQSFSMPQQSQFVPQQQPNGQINLIDAFSGRGETRSQMPFANADFNAKFFDPRLQKYERPPNYNVSGEKAAIYAMVSQKTNTIDRTRYG
jgi:hypothetical protein